MRLLPVFFLLFVGLACGQQVTVDPLFRYHELIGIPEAARIKAEEGQIHRANANRIVGGASSEIISHPYMAGLVISFANIVGQSACGASLVSASRLVTAGHCWSDGVNQASQFVVVLGSQFLFSGGTRIATSNVITHPEYQPWISAIRNDIAVIYLPTSVAFSTAIQPVSLPSTLELNNDFVGLWATAVGYGKTSDLEAGVSSNTFRREVNVQVTTTAQCQSVYGAATVLASNICTSGVGGVGICGGDSGGPLTVFSNGQRILVGVSSFVAQNACHLGYPSAFARITSFYSFVMQHLV